MAMTFAHLVMQKKQKCAKWLFVHALMKELLLLLLPMFPRDSFVSLPP